MNKLTTNGADFETLLDKQNPHYEKLKKLFEAGYTPIVEEHPVSYVLYICCLTEMTASEKVRILTAPLDDYLKTPIALAFSYMSKEEILEFMTELLALKVFRPARSHIIAIQNFVEIGNTCEIAYHLKQFLNFNPRLNSYQKTEPKIKSENTWTKLNKLWRSLF